MSETTGSRIAERRRALGMKPFVLAASIGKSVPTLYRYESSNYDKIPSDVIDQLAIALKTSVAYLMLFTADPDAIVSTQTAEEYLNTIKRTRLVTDAFMQEHSQRFINQMRLKGALRNHLEYLTTEDMDHVVSYISFLASKRQSDQKK